MCQDNGHAMITLFMSYIGIASQLPVFMFSTNICLMLL